MTFNWKHTLALGWPILSILFICSIVTVAVALQCWSAAGNCRKLAGSVGQADRNRLAEYIAMMEQRLALLGTIANAAPFIGLLGTVVGIIRAFHSISTNAGGGMSAVAGGISEALVSTAAGLAVAIPASMIYNYFTFHSGRIAKDAGLE